MLKCFRFKNINIDKINSIDFIDNSYPENINMKQWEIESIYYDRQEKLYTIENIDGIIFNTNNIKLKYEKNLK